MKSIMKNGIVQQKKEKEVVKLNREYEKKNLDEFVQKWLSHPKLVPLFKPAIEEVQVKANLKLEAGEDVSLKAKETIHSIGVASIRFFGFMEN